jgi:hypothetical protein
LKEKKRIQQLLDAKKNTEKLKESEAIQKADAFYRKYLLRYYGLNGFKKLVDMENKKWKLATRIYTMRMFKRIFVSWKISARMEASVKEKIADEFHGRLIVKNCYFNGIKLFKQSLQIEMAKASRFYRYNIKLKLFTQWKVYVKSEREKGAHNEALIEVHNRERIQRVYFGLWRAYPAEQRRLKARQKRLDDLRSKVKEMLPDFETPASARTMNASSSPNSSLK